MRPLNGIVVLLLLMAGLRVQAQTTPAPAPTDPALQALQEQINAKFEAANPSSSPDGLTFYPAPGYNGPKIKPFRPTDAHHVWKPSVVLNPDEKLVYCTTGTTLALAGSAISQSFSRAALDVDHRQVATDDVAPITQDYLFYWNASDPGTHTLRIVFTLDTGPLVARSVHVIVSDTAPVSPAAIASPCETDTTVTLTRTAMIGFKPARTMIVVNDSGFDLTDSRTALVIPATNLPRGTYTISIVPVTAEGVRFVSMPHIVAVQHEQ